MTKSNPLDKARKLAQEMIEKRDKASEGPWVMTLGSPDGFPDVFLDEAKEKDFTIADMNFIDSASVTAKPLAEMVLRLIRALELCKEQRDDFLKRELQSTYIDEAIPDIMKKVYAYLNAEIQAVLEGEK